MQGTTPGFEKDIRPLFRAKDIDSMASRFDLSAYDDVRAHSQGIYKRLQAGTMPCDGAWPADDVTLFGQWIDAGCPA
jgi:hypothetical protein